MTRPHPNRKPRFLWQAVLIVLPVFVLAAVGLSSLRQDKLLAEQEARERARQIADELADKIWNEVAVLRLDLSPQNQLDRLNAPGPKNLDAFQISVQGDLVYPPPYTPVPVPHPFEATRLNPDQARLWQVAREADFAGTNSDAAIEAYHQFVARMPPDNFVAAAHFSLGLLLLNQSRYSAAAGAFDLVCERYPTATGESGLSFALLAQMKSIALAMASSNQVVSARVSSLETLCSNAVFRPTFLTPQLLKQAAAWEQTRSIVNPVAERWLMIWQNHERARRLHAAARLQWQSAGKLVSTGTGVPDDPPSRTPVGPAEGEKRMNAGLASAASPGPPRLFWIAADEDWLAVASRSDSSNTWYTCLRHAEVQRIVREITENAGIVPSYFAVTVELAGKDLGVSPGTQNWNASNKNGGILAAYTAFTGASLPTLLASAGKPEAADRLLRINAYLTDPATFFARQRIRTTWFGLLIGVSASVALAGLITAWRAFDRQQRLAEMKTNFVSSVSHELRAPIASVRLMAESLDRGKISDAQKQADYFRLIVQECRRLTALIENVLDFSRIGQGSKQYEFEATDLVALVEQTLKLMEPYATERQVTLNVAMDRHQLSTLNAQPEIDARAIQQALVNLLDNAIKHAPPGTSVTAGLESSLNSQPSTIGLFVEDHGEGIPPEEHEKIFEPFYRRGTELRRETRGIGIGLTIVKHIVEAHGGTVAVRSAVGQGSRFTIELPMEEIPKPKRQ